MLSLYSAVRRIQKGSNPPKFEKNLDLLRFGLLGAARIAPDAVIKPAMYHEGVVVLAVAARNLERAEKFGEKWNIPVQYGGPDGYEKLVNNPQIDVVYIGLPNALHFKWTMKALAAGKHVLCEKPIADTANEARQMFALAETKGLVLLEAWQPAFHPVLPRIKELIAEESLGRIISMSAHLGVHSSLFFVEGDIRFSFDLGGGALMDMGPYPINMMRALASSDPTVESATAICRDESSYIDRQIDAHLTFHSGIHAIPARIILDSGLEGWGPFKLLPQWPKFALRIACENGNVEVRNYVLPHIWHTIVVVPKNGRVRKEKAYKPKYGRGEEWWSAYRYQLEAFVDKVRGQEPHAWRSSEDSLDSMRIIDEVYTKTGLPLRPESKFKPVQVDRGKGGLDDLL